MRQSLFVMGVLALLAGVPAAARAQEDDVPKTDVKKWSFAVSKGGKLLGRLDVGVAKSADTLFASAPYYADPAAVKAKRGLKPAVRSYAELSPDGALGKYKRWETKGKGAQYWFAFPFEKKIRLRYEKGVGDKGKVKDLGTGDKVLPLDAGQPHLAYLRVGDGKPADFACVAANPSAFGKAHVAKAGQEDVDLYGGGKATLTHWAVTGDCGDFQVYVDDKGEPVVMATGALRYDRLGK